MEQMASGWGVGLLEYMAHRTGCEYLSDLRYLSCWEQVRLSREVSRIPAAAFPLETWNDALAYLTSLPPATQAALAKEKLIQNLGKQARHRAFPKSTG